MTKKIEPTEAYLKTLEQDLSSAILSFDLAKKTLYRVTATAKLGEPEFENARKQCLESHAKREKLEGMIASVKRVLGR